MPSDVPHTSIPFPIFSLGCRSSKHKLLQGNISGFEVELPLKKPEQLICITFTPAYTQSLIFTPSFTRELSIPLW